MNDQPNGSPPRDGDAPPAPSLTETVRGWLRGLRRLRNGESSVRDTLEELIEERDDAEASIAEDERVLLSNILDLRDRTVHDVMVPRADIIAVENGAPRSQVIALMTREGHSRLPVHGETLDDIIGMVHIKDVAARPEDEAFTLSKIVRRVLFVSPSMQVLELLLEMRVTRSHMAVVVDEYGGVDGLVTIEDLVEEIVGEIEDEHDRGDEPTLVKRSDGSLDADARATLEALEEITGPVVNEEERADIDTLGGLVFSLAGHVPIRGELVSHPCGLEFEVIDADPRRIKRLRVRGLPGEPAKQA
ncbi:MAG: hemolysin family protein [Rhodospirillales bacterium]|nr:hemolysin family protein [Rhodospirillales bacterium]MDP6773301.1 hemolysin family protein [Rhodospirillales bacterium]